MRTAWSTVLEDGCVRIFEPWTADGPPAGCTSHHACRTVKTTLLDPYTKPSEPEALSLERRERCH
jgi:hypothetical protein